MGHGRRSTIIVRYNSNPANLTLIEPKIQYLSIHEKNFQSRARDSVRSRDGETMDAFRTQANM